MANKYYAVKCGRQTGLFRDWNSCRTQVQGYPGAVFKSFPTEEEALAFLGPAAACAGEETPAKAGISPEKTSYAEEAYAFVDGSYNAATGVYGYGGFLRRGEEEYILQGSGADPQMASMRNVAGEILGSRAAVEKAMELGITRLDVYYDYMGIQMWAEGSWKRNKAGTVAYYDFMQSVKDRIRVRFVKVKGHSGVEGNELADHLAKQASGVEE